MDIVVILLTFHGVSLQLGCVAVSAIVPEQTLGGPSGLRIIHGKEASPIQFPWQAGLLTLDANFFCGGSIIDKEWILTAGHCVDPFEEFQVVVGSLDMPKGKESHRQVFTTSEKYQHPQYNMVYLDNDVGLLKLPQKIKYSLVVKKIHLPTYTMVKDNLVGKQALVSGWGKSHDDAQASPVLKYTSLKILPNSDCERIYGNTIIMNKLCLGAENGESVCQGDSGGALVMRQEDDPSETVYQIGITSFVSNEGCTVNMPQGFTRVSSFLEYIRGITGIAIDD